MGVKRAVDLALEHSGNTSGGIKTLGPLIHNEQTLEVLKQRGVNVLDESKELSSKSTVLVRAHGVPPQILQKYSDNGHVIIDGTCPKVKAVHKVIERYRSQGYEIIITGDEGHAEVIGLMGYAGENGHLIQTIDDLNKLPDYKKVCLVSQTTFDRLLFDTIADAVRRRYALSEVIIKKTICAATDQRQAETEILAQQVDALIVVGGKNSANTQRLAKIGIDSGKITQHVETEKEIDWDAISQCDTVGITAGASTPTWMIKRVQDYIEFMSQTRRRTVKNVIFHLIDIFVNINLFVSLGAVAAYYASCYLQGFSFNTGGAAIAFLYFLSMYLWNSLANIEKTQHHGISRYHFYHAHKKLLYIIVTAIILVTCSFCFFYSIMLFYLIFTATLAGLAYHMSIVPSFLRRILPYRTLKDIPTSRELFIALAWGTVLTFLPQALAGQFNIDILSVALFAWIFILAYLRSMIFDLRDIEGDRIMGHETLITIIGDKRARKFMLIMIWISLAALLIVPSVLGFSVYKSAKAIQFFYQIPVLFYAFAFIKWNQRLEQNRTTLFNILTDGIFYLMAASAAIASAVLD